MPKTRLQKETTVTEITDKLNRAKSVVFADYQGMTMTDLSALRKTLREQGAEFSVTKNNLLKLALITNHQLPDTDQFLSGPVATLFSYEDEVLPIKTLTKAIKDSQKGKIKAGIVDGQFFEAVQINKLATLPSKDELRAKVVGTLGAPLYGIVGVLQANLRNLVYVMDQIRIQKGGEN